MKKHPVCSIINQHLNDHLFIQIERVPPHDSFYASRRGEDDDLDRDDHDINLIPAFLKIKKELKKGRFSRSLLLLNTSRIISKINLQYATP